MTSEKIPLMRPTLSEWDEIAPRFREVYESGNLTLGSFTKKLEEYTARALNVAHAVAVSSCTSGLMLVMRALDLRGEIVMPSFTWTSTGLAAVWNNLTPVFADCSEETYTLDPDQVRRLITKNTAAVAAVNVFGLYPDMDALAAICREAGVPLLSDSAQGIGATCKGRISGGLADVEVFSLSPTKVVTAVEGGLVTTNDARLAERIRSMRDYGKSADAGDIVLLGLSARLGEFHAVVGLSGFERLGELLQKRAAIFRRYREGLGSVPGLRFQEIPEGYTTSGNYFIIFPDPKTCPREKLAERLRHRGIATKPYFHPALHKQQVFAHLPPPRLPLPVTEAASASGLALPIFTHMPPETLDRICAAVREEFS